jgi:FtsH-binding integral membrane protein
LRVARQLLSHARMTQDRKKTSQGWGHEQPAPQAQYPQQSWSASMDDAQQAPSPWSEQQQQQQQPGQPWPNAGQPNAGQPQAGQPWPNAGQPQAGQPWPNAGQPNAGQANAGQPYPGQSYPGQSYPGGQPPPQAWGQQGAQPPAQPYPQNPQYAQQPSPYPQYAQPAAGPPPYDYWSQQQQQQRQAPPAPGAGGDRVIARADATRGVSPRVRFIRLTYLHLLGAVLAFAGLLYLFRTQPVLVTKVSAPLINFALAKRWNWGVVLVVFMAVSWVADRWANNARSTLVQYLGLAFYTLAEALIFVPLLAIVEWKTQAILARGGADPHIIRDAAYVTVGVFSALTLSVFFTRKDFSFLGGGLAMASGAALSLIFLSLTFGFSLGLIFSVAMVLLAAGYILYQTSQILAHADPHRHVAAALALFSSVALMFWYVIRIFLRARN